MTGHLDPDAYPDSIADRHEADAHRAPRYTTEEIALAMRFLRGRRFEVFYLHSVERLGYAEIAERLGISAKRVERLMAQALFRLIRATRAIRAHGVRTVDALPLGVRLGLWLGL